MRHIPSALQAKLDGGATTLCRCWIVTRRDGTAQGFTDHDRDLALGDVVCRAGSGFGASEATSRFDLSASASEVAGALSDDALNEDDLAASRFDAAQVRTYLVDWSDPSLNVLLSSGVLGEVKRKGAAFTAELRGLADALAQESGRLFIATCNADLGDARCGVDLSNEALRGEGVVAALTGASALRASGLDSFDDGFFTAGKLVWTSGANSGLAIEVKEHRADDGGVTLLLWQMPPQPMAVGDAFSVTAGCDKRFATCRDRFGNAVNFRGFPHIPGNDFVLSYPQAGAQSDSGGKLVG